VPVDLPIEIPRKDGVPPLNVPTASNSALTERQATAPAEQGSGIVSDTTSAPAASTPVHVAVAEPARAVETPKVEPRKEAVAKADTKSEAKPETKPEGKPDAKSDSHKANDLQEKSARPTDKPADKASDKPQGRQAADHARDADAARAMALLEGREPPKPAVDKKAPEASGVRFIVQVGAFAEARSAQDMRGKVEKLGLKTYTQAVETPDGKRIRVRVGPFASREEADRAAAKLRGSGLAGTVLTL
jgi:DedD protein